MSCNTDWITTGALAYYHYGIQTTVSSPHRLLVIHYKVRAGVDNLNGTV